MTLEELRTARLAAELEIMDVLVRFKAKTGLSIASCSIETVSFTRLEDGRSIKLPARVYVKVEI